MMKKITLTITFSEGEGVPEVKNVSETDDSESTTEEMNYDGMGVSYDNDEAEEAEESEGDEYDDEDDVDGSKMSKILQEVAQNKNADDGKLVE